MASTTASTITSTTGRAAVFYGPGQPLRIEHLDLPELAEGEVLVDVLCSTICGSDIRTFRGQRTEPTPCILGHEIVGVVRQACDTAQDIRGVPITAGERIVWSVAASCPERANQKCVMCQRGFSQKCTRLKKFGHEKIADSWKFSGGLAEVCHLPIGTRIAKLNNPGITDTSACFLSCAAATAMEVVHSAGELQNRRALVIGAGPLGLFAAAAAHTLGAEVTVCESDATRRRRSLQFGAASTLTPEGLASSNNCFDIILEMSGARQAMQHCVAACDTGGWIVLAGSVYPTDPISLAPESVVRKLLTIRGVHNYGPKSLLRSVDFMCDNLGRFDFDCLVNGTFALTDVNAAFEAAQLQPGVRIGLRP